MNESSTNPWLVSESDFPHGGSSTEKLRFLLNYAVLAPSRYNAQPWLYKITGGDLRLYADRTRALPASDPDDRALIVGCGAALHYLGVAIRHFGYTANLHTFPDLNDEDLLAVVRLGSREKSSPDSDTFFPALSLQPQENIDQDLTGPKLIDPEIARLGVKISRASANDILIPLERIVMDSIVRESLNPAILAERTSWEAQLKAAQRQSGNDRENVIHQNGYALAPSDGRNEIPPELVVVSTAGDNTASWFAAGQALAHVMLEATVAGFCACPIHAPIESVRSRSEISELLGLSEFPQVLVRLERDIHPVGAPRRPVHDVLLTQRHV